MHRPFVAAQALPCPNVRILGSLPAPHAWLEFDVDDVERATAELESMGYRMLIKNEKEPWGQTVSRFLASDGILVGLAPHIGVLV